MHHSRKYNRVGNRGGTRRPGTAFTLIELLTTIAIIAVLASLLFTALASAKKKSRQTVCVSNLHQMSVALNLYVDDTASRPTMKDLVAGHYLSSPKVLCPEDKTGNWGNLMLAPPQVVTPLNASNAPSVAYSYLMHPLAWDIALWNFLMKSSVQSGLAACQLHGLGKQDYSDVHNFTGLLLRAQRDGAVVRRQLFWNSGTVLPIPGVPGSTNQPYLYPLPIYVDNPAEWLQSGQ